MCFPPGARPPEIPSDLLPISGGAGGQDVILIGGEQVGEFRASIKHLEGWDVRSWRLRQYNPPRGEKAELTWPKKDWPKALRVVGKYYGG